MPNSAASIAGASCGSYVMRNALVPQVTGLAMSLGAIFNGAIITEQVFGYPGLGTLLVAPSMPATTAWCSASPRCRSSRCRSAVLLIDLVYPLLDPRVRVALSDGTHPPRSPALQPPSSRIGVVLIGSSSRACRCLSFFSPYPPNDSFVVPPDVPPSLGLSGSARRRAARTCSGS